MTIDTINITTFIHLNLLIIVLIHRFNVPTRPTETIDKAIAFVTNTNAIESSLSFISNPVAENYNEDFMQGLDGILTDEDVRFLEYTKRYGPLSNGH